MITAASLSCVLLFSTSSSNGYQLTSNDHHYRICLLQFSKMQSFAWEKLSHITMVVPIDIFQWCFIFVRNVGTKHLISTCKIAILKINERITRLIIILASGRMAEYGMGEYDNMAVYVSWTLVFPEKLLFTCMVRGTVANEKTILTSTVSLQVPLHTFACTGFFACTSVSSQH